MSCARIARVASQAALLLLLGGPVLLAQTSTEEQDYQAALASSAPFDLKPSQPKASFHLRRMTLHSLYDEIARAYGVRLIYDSNLPDRPVPGDFDMDDATFQETLDAAGSVSKTFVAPLDSHSGMVAADTGEKRAEYERQIMATFHLDDQMTTQQLSDVTTALRTLVDLRRVSQDSRTNWITVVGRTRQVEAASELVQSLDKAAGEVMLEFQVWEVDTNRARDLGILPPQPFSLVYLGPPVVNLLSAVASSAAAATPLSLLNWGQLETLYGVQIPGLTAFLNSSTNLVRFQQVLHLRATNGEEASLLLGTRVPVITGIVSSVIESPGGPPTNIINNTQGFIPNIQYEDTGVVVHATPHFHADGEMTLQLDFALRALGPTEANGIPSFTNREVINQVRLGYGEAYLIGGILNRTDQKAVTGYPWLSRIPVLRWLFSHEAKASTETELLILVKPTILRVAAADQIASRSIFFGKELTGLPAAVAPPPQPVAPQPGFPVQPGANQPGQPTQPGAPQPAAPTSAEPGVQPYIGQPVQPVTPGQPVPFPGRAFPQGAPQPFPGQQQPNQQQQPPAVNNPEQ